MRNRAALSCVALVAILSGCAGGMVETASTPTPTPTLVDVNAKACGEFANVLSKLSDVVGAGESTIDDWDAVMAELDEVGLAAQGDVKERILAITNDPPRFGDVLFGDSTIVEDLERVTRACGFS